MRRTLLFFLIVLGTATVLEAETYLIPIWSNGVAGSDAVWYARVTVSNPNPFPVVLRPTRAFPLDTEPCGSCRAEEREISLPPFSSAQVLPPVPQDGVRMTIGAFELQSDHPVSVSVVAIGKGEREIRQRLQVGRRWLGSGTYSVSDVQRSPVGWRMNVFVVNPGTHDLLVSIWTGPRMYNEVRAAIPAGRTALIGLPPPSCGPVPCPPLPDVYPPLPTTVEIEASDAFFASVSSVTSDWAVFSLPDVVGTE